MQQNLFYFLFQLIPMCTSITFKGTFVQGQVEFKLGLEWVIFSMEDPVRSQPREKRPCNQGNRIGLCWHAFAFDLAATH